MLGTSNVVISFNDRLGRRLVLTCNHDQKCVVGTWIEEDISLQYPVEDTMIDNTTLYGLLFPKG